MALDPSIILQARGVELQNPMDLASKAMTMRQMAMQGQAQERELARQTAIQNAYKSGVVTNPDGTQSFNPQMTALALAQGGYGQEAQNFLKAAQDESWRTRDFGLRERELQSKALDRADARDERRFQAGVKLDEKRQTLATPYGLANTPDDAKQLKEAHEAKASFDSKIQEMIDLRKKYGTEYLNREAVARGKQLSKDLLLEYKNMAKLGVLSKSDEDIINAIIPSDPLGQDWAPGQDPILSNLTKFKQDSDRDFNTRVQTRTRNGTPASSIGQTKVIGGVTYHKVDGGWLPE